MTISAGPWAPARQANRATSSESATTTPGTTGQCAVLLELASWPLAQTVVVRNYCAKRVSRLGAQDSWPNLLVFRSRTLEHAEERLAPPLPVTQPSFKVVLRSQWPYGVRSTPSHSTNRAGLFPACQPLCPQVQGDEVEASLHAIDKSSTANFNIGQDQAKDNL